MNHDLCYILRRECKVAKRIQLHAFGWFLIWESRTRGELITGLENVPPVPKIRTRLDYGLTFEDSDVLY